MTINEVGEVEAAELIRQVHDGLARACGRIEAACQASGRAREEVRLLLATKQQPVVAIRAAIRDGGHLIGENRVQELVAKGPDLADLPHETHLIGPLQTNKINAALRWATCVETVDSLKLAERLAARFQDRAGGIGVLIQVNTSGETTKSGVEPAAARDLAWQVAALGGLRLEGFMTVGLNSDDAAAVGRSYAVLRDIRDCVVTSGVPGTDRAVELSMGMSGDLEVAIAEGATIVRLGTAVFGVRAA
ncbi:MAG: YggS family pyridoxal phosphate-dependent enzyme [Bifidobacteriaceae bacterium]|nr:YggS family pyridoxal phosphate-dependent enzyme [Bifidobacteriaceae bacterium]